MNNVAQSFASFLDQTRFDDAVELMSPDCEYHYWEGNYVGNNNIANLYKQNHKNSDTLFDEIRYSSEVDEISNEEYLLKFTDHIRVGEKWHDLRFDNIVRVQDDRIVDIRHEELPGEKESFMQFMNEARPRSVANAY